MEKILFFAKPLWLPGLFLVLLCGGAYAAEPSRQPERRPVRIGILSTQSSAWGEATGQGTVLAAQMAAEEFGGAAKGIPVEVLFADHHNRPKLGATLARRWLEHSGVDVIMDVPNGAVAEAVRGAIKEKDGMMILSGTGFYTPGFCHDNIFGWTYDLAAMSRFALNALKRGGFTQIYLLNLDKSHGNVGAFREFVKTAGFAKFEELSRHVPRYEKPHDESGAQPVFSPDHAVFHHGQALAALGAHPAALRNLAPKLRSEMQDRKFEALYCQACAGLLADTDIAALAEKIYFVMPYELDSEGLEDFAARYRARGGALPTMAQTGIYAAVKAYLAAAMAGKRHQASEVAGRLRAMKLEDPIFGASILTPNGLRRGTYYLYAYDTARRQHDLLDSLDMTKDTPWEKCPPPAQTVEER